MMNRVIVRHIAAAGLVASCAGLAVGAKYDPTSLGAPARVTTAAAAAGTVSLTKAATKVYGSGGSYNAVKISAPIIMDRTDGFFNNACAEVLNGTPKAVNTTFDDVFVNAPRLTSDEEKLFNHWGLALYNFIALGTPTGNDVVLDESITAVEIAQNPAVSYNVNYRDWSNGMGALLTDGTALFRANFNSARSPSQNNVEFLSLGGAVPAPVSGGSKIFTTGNGIDAVGAGSSFISPPSGARLNNGNLVVGQVVFGSGAAKVGVMATVYSGARVSWTTPPYRWPVEQYPLITDTNGKYPTDIDLRTSNHRMTKLARSGCNTETTYVSFGEGSVTAPLGALPPNDHLFTGSGFGPKVLFVDTVDTGVAQNLNGFTNGFAWISADPAATYTPGTVGGRGQIGPISNNYRFIEIQGTGSNGFAMHDINAKGQVVALWADFTDTLAPVYEVRRYDPIFDTVDACKIVGYGQPKVIAKNGVTYAGGSFVLANDSFLSGGPCPTAVTLGTSLDAPFGGVSIDDAGNVSFIGVIESNEVQVTYVDCNNIPLGTVPDVRSSTQALCFYDSATDSLYRIMQSGQNGDVLTGPGPSYKIGRIPVSNNDSDAYGAEGAADVGKVFAVNARSGTDEGNTDSNNDGFQQDGGTLNPGLASETAARATILVELGAYTPPAPACIGDLNGDNLVNVGDLTIFLGQFGRTCAQIAPAQCADFNSDNIVNVSDLTVFLGRFGQSCN
jgi:hypothetical protein